MSTNHSKDALVFLEKLTQKSLALGNLLYSIRQGESLSQSEFAKLLGVSKQYVCDLEHGRRFVSPKSAQDYAKKLGYSQDQFVRLCLQDLLKRDGIDMEVELRAA